MPPDPAITAALVWLRRHVPSCDEITLVHGDFRLGNFLVERDGDGARLTGVLDWEMVHLGDPLEDLAWCAVAAVARAAPTSRAASLPPEEMAAAYAARGGRTVDPERLRFYDVLTLVKMIAIMLTGIRAFNDGRTHDLRMAIFDHQLPYLLIVLAMTAGLLRRR